MNYFSKNESFSLVKLLLILKQIPSGRHFDLTSTKLSTAKLRQGTMNISSLTYSASGSSMFQWAAHEPLVLSVPYLIHQSTS